MLSRLRLRGDRRKLPITPKKGRHAHNQRSQDELRPKTPGSIGRRFASYRRYARSFHFQVRRQDQSKRHVCSAGSMSTTNTSLLILAKRSRVSAISTPILTSTHPHRGDLSSTLHTPCMFAQGELRMIFSLPSFRLTGTTHLNSLRPCGTFQQPAGFSMAIAPGVLLTAARSRQTCPQSIDGGIQDAETQILSSCRYWVARFAA